MKKSISILLSIVLSVLIVYGGSGINAYFYCCNDCRTENVMNITGPSCCDSFHHAVNEGSMNTVSIPNQSDQCSINRITTNWAYFITKNTDIEPVSFDLSASFLLNNTWDFTTGISDKNERLFFSDTQRPPGISKDVSFSLLNVLTI